MFKKLTFSMIKPDATQRKLAGKIIFDIENSGFEIINQKILILPQRMAEDFYDIHKEKPFFNDMIREIISGPVFVQVLRKENAIPDYRALMGATNPLEAEEGTLRKKYGIVIDKNSVHGSDSVENAEREIGFFFGRNELAL